MNDSRTCDDPQFPCHRPHHVPLRSTTLPATPARHVTTDHVPLLILPTTTRDTHWHPPSPHHPYTSTGTHNPQTRHVPRSHVPYHVPSHVAILNTALHASPHHALPHSHAFPHVHTHSPTRIHTDFTRSRSRSHHTPFTPCTPPLPHADVRTLPSRATHITHLFYTRPRVVLRSPNSTRPLRTPLTLNILLTRPSRAPAPLLTRNRTQAQAWRGTGPPPEIPPASKS